MPDEPDHPIEGELRAWAESRRAAQPPDFEMHAATRRLLHGEAARVHGRAAAKPASAAVGSFLWWRSVLVGATVAFAIGCVIWVSLPGRAPMQLARTEPAVERQSGGSLSDFLESAPVPAMDAPSPALRGASTDALAANETAAADRSLAAARMAGGGAGLKTEMLKDAEKKTQAGADEPQSAAMLAFSAPAAATTATPAEAEASGRASAVPPAAAVPMAKAAVVTADAGALAAAPVRQRFQQRAASAEGAVLRRSLTTPDWPVLREFELLLGVAETTVRDADGSRYTGAPVAEPPPGAFVVTGTNLTLGAVVRFEGTVERAGTNLLRVTGRARIGTDRELTVDAAPAPPR